jgi:hypothetical protein
MRLIFYITLLAVSVVSNAVAQPKTRVHIKIIEGDTKSITPAMVCITNVETARVHLPPKGTIAGSPTYPDIFFDGIAFSNAKNWVGPVRKMRGEGKVNGQRTYVYNPNASLPYWAESVQYQTSGDFTIDLYPGRWRIAVQHGNEYVPATLTFSISHAAKRVTKTITLERWINLPNRGWWSGDVHTHHPLYKKEFQAYMLQLAKAEDVHLLNVLQMGDSKHTYFEPEGFGSAFQRGARNHCFATGQEEPRSDYGHVIGLNGNALARDTTHYKYYDFVFNKLHQKQEALAGFAHFAYGGEGVKEGLAIYAPTGAIDFVELLQNTKIDTATYYSYLNLGFRLTAAAGSDFPWGSTVGDGRTFVYTGKKFSPHAWFAGLKRGNSFVSNGPGLFLTGSGQLPGSTIEKKIGDTILLAVQTFSNPHIGVIDKIMVYNNDGLLLQKINLKNKDSMTFEITHTLTKSQWITAAVYCRNGALAHTSPLYVVVAEKPTYDAVKGPAVVHRLLEVLNNAKAREAAKPRADTGLIQRIAAAETFYQRLLVQLQSNDK